MHVDHSLSDGVAYSFMFTYACTSTEPRSCADLPRIRPRSCIPTRQIQNMYARGLAAAASNDWSLHSLEPGSLEFRPREPGGSAYNRSTLAQQGLPSGLLNLDVSSTQTSMCGGAGCTADHKSLSTHRARPAIQCSCKTASCKLQTPAGALASFSPVYPAQIT